MAHSFARTEGFDTGSEFADVRREIIGIEHHRGTGINLNEPRSRSEVNDVVRSRVVASGEHIDVPAPGSESNRHFVDVRVHAPGFAASEWRER